MCLFCAKSFLNNRCLTTKSPIVFLCWQKSCTPFMADNLSLSLSLSLTHTHTSSVFYCDIGSLQELCWKNIAPEEFGSKLPRVNQQPPAHHHKEKNWARVNQQPLAAPWWIGWMDGWMDWCLDVVQSWNPLFNCGLSSKHNNFFVKSINHHLVCCTKRVVNRGDPVSPDPNYMLRSCVDKETSSLCPDPMLSLFQNHCPTSYHHSRWLPLLLHNLEFWSLPFLHTHTSLSAFSTKCTELLKNWASACSSNSSRKQISTHNRSTGTIPVAKDSSLETPDFIL